ncbi:hypothetical protein PYH37_005611 [Sinorhizobium numidicum]|uniref:Uncharacterized protein n=1 Tax=Sinorhizobium numidicum TaxID=680248 RepID=A0ABY8CZ10_9HYPH|nr:hypothetical protein [Sinorhizobium numidicum]WEX77222.1 hypothetical protein PYH37_005611 [Sinorhizobium numidicum]WEX83881.1 hypothetical protein PYH38_002704 [Sinorhizobium numidicum]
MNLLQAVRATKVLLLACALALPPSLPVKAADGQGLPEVQTRVRHIRLHHRPPHHASRKWHGSRRFFAGHRRHRSVITSIDRFASFAPRGLPDVQTRTRHVRLKHRLPRHAWRSGHHGPTIFIIGGNYGSANYGGYDFPSVTPGIGTYAGGISAFREEGNGIYFSRDGGYGYFAENIAEPTPPAKRAKIIIVSPQTNASACSWEHGVCVVRP